MTETPSPIETEQRERVVAELKAALIAWDRYDPAFTPGEIVKQALAIINPARSLVAALAEAEAMSEQRRLVVAHLREEAEKHKQALSTQQQENERLREALKIAEAYALATLNGIIESGIEAEIVATAQADKAVIAEALQAPPRQGIGYADEGERVLSPEIPIQGGEDHAG